MIKLNFIWSWAWKKKRKCNSNRMKFVEEEGGRREDEHQQRINVGSTIKKRTGKTNTHRTIYFLLHFWWFQQNSFLFSSSLPNRRRKNPQNIPKKNFIIGNSATCMCIRILSLFLFFSLEFSKRLNIQGKQTHWTVNCEYIICSDTFQIRAIIAKMK